MHQVKRLSSVYCLQFAYFYLHHTRWGDDLRYRYVGQQNIDLMFIQHSYNLSPHAQWIDNSVRYSCFFKHHSTREGGISHPP